MRGNDNDRGILSNACHFTACFIADDLAKMRPFPQREFMRTGINQHGWTKSAGGNYHISIP